MDRSSGGQATAQLSPSATVAFRAADVTRTVTMEASDIQKSAPAGAVAQALAARMELPMNVPWSLRRDASGAFLEDDAPIGEQIAQTGESLTVAPKAHLG